MHEGMHELSWEWAHEWELMKMWRANYRIRKAEQRNESLEGKLKRVGWLNLSQMCRYLGTHAKNKKVRALIKEKGYDKLTRGGQMTFLKSEIETLEQEINNEHEHI